MIRLGGEPTIYPEMHGYKCAHTHQIWALEKEEREEGRDTDLASVQIQS